MPIAYHLCCITKNGTNPAYQGARIGAHRIAERAGSTITHSFPQSPDNAEEQAALLEQALAERPDAILLAPAHPTALDATIRKVEAAGIPLVYFVSQSDAVKALTFVSSNNYSLALEIANYLIRSLDGAGDLVVMEGSPHSATSQPRTQGFLDAAAAHPQVRIVAQKSGYYQRSDAYTAMTEVLQGHSKIDGILSANDYMGMGIIDALRDARRSAALVGVNAMPDAIAAIKAGTMRATAAYDAMKMACIATEATLRMLSGQPVPELIELPVDIVDAGNCALWDLPYEERPLPVWEETVSKAR